MANIKSAKKRIKVINKKTLRNKMIKSQVKTAMKKVIVAVNAGDKETAAVALKNAVNSLTSQGRNSCFPPEKGI